MIAAAYVAKSMVGQHPAYASRPDWCTYFVEDVLRKAHSKTTLYSNFLPPARHPRPGDIVFFNLHSAHVAILIRMDRKEIYVINGNGSSRETVTADRYPRSTVAGFYRS